MTTEVILSGTTWTVPAGVTSIAFKLMGAGGAGFGGASGRAGGGGGAYVEDTLTVTALETLTIQVPAAGVQSTTYIKRSGTTLLEADFGRTGTSGVGGAAGATANCTGTTKVAGGAGSNGASSGGGGGGAGGPNNAGGAGGASPGSGAGGGGGANSAAAGASGSGSTAGAGGTKFGGGGGGTAPGGAGTGGGGGGGGNTSTAGGAGSTQVLFTDDSGGANNAVAVGSGGGGGGGASSKNGGAAGTYGGGGGGSGTTTGAVPGAGGRAFIVAVYTASGGLTDPAPSDSVTPSEALAQAFSKAIADSVTPSEALTNAVSHPLADSATPSEVLSTGDTLTLSLNDTATANDGSGDAVTLVFGEALGDSVTPTEALVFAASHPLADSATPSEALTNAVSHTLVDSATPTEALSNAPGPALADSVTPTDSGTVMGASPALSDSVTPSEAMTFNVSHQLADNATPTEALGNALSRAIADSVTPSESITPVLNPPSTLTLNDSVQVTDDGYTSGSALDQTETLVITDALAFDLSKPVTDSVTPSEAIGAGTAFADSVTVSDSVVTTSSGGLSLSDSVIAVDSGDASAVDLALADTALPADASVRGISPALSDSVTPSESLYPGPSDPHPSEIVTATDTVAMEVQPRFSETLVADDVQASAVSRSATDSVTLSDAYVNAPGKNLTEILTITDTDHALDYLKPVAEVVVADDSTTKDIGHGFIDTALVSDGLIPGQATTLALNDSVTSSDAAPVTSVSSPSGFHYARTLTDAVTIADAAVTHTRAEGHRAKFVLSRALWAPPRIVRPSIQARVEIGRLLALNLSDTTGVGDTLSATKGTYTATDSVTVADAIAKTYAKMLADSAAATDAAPDLNTFPPKPNDTVTIGDAMVRNYTKALTETLNITDSVGNAMALARADSVTAAEVISAGGALYVSTDHRGGALSTTYDLSTLAVGDMVIVIATGVAPPAVANPGWSEVISITWVYGYTTLVAFKVMTAADISAGSVLINNTDYTCTELVYKNATNLVFRQEANSYTTTYTIPGFVKAADSKGVIAVVIDRDPGISITSPAGWAVRLNDGGAMYFTTEIADQSPSGYADNSAVIFTAGATTYNGEGFLLELR